MTVAVAESFLTEPQLAIHMTILAKGFSARACEWPE